MKLSSHFENAPHPQTQKARKKKNQQQKSASHSPAQASKHRKIYRSMLVAAKLKTNQLPILPREKPTKQKLKNRKDRSYGGRTPPKKRSTPKKKSNGIFFQIKQNQNNNRLSESCSRTTHLNRKQNDCANAETNQSWRRAELLAPRRPAKKAALFKGQGGRGEREREREERRYPPGLKQRGTTALGENTFP